MHCIFKSYCIYNYTVWWSLWIVDMRVCLPHWADRCRANRPSSFIWYPVVCPHYSGTCTCIYLVHFSECPPKVLLYSFLLLVRFFLTFLKEWLFFHFWANFVYLIHVLFKEYNFSLLPRVLSVFCSSGPWGTRPVATYRGSMTLWPHSLSSFSPTISVSCMYMYIPLPAQPVSHTCSMGLYNWFQIQIWPD